MTTFRGKEITEEDLNNGNYCLELCKTISYAITNEDYSEVSHEIILDTVPNSIRMRDAILYVVNKSFATRKNLYTFISDVPKELWPKEPIRLAKLLQLLAAIAMIEGAQDTCAKLIEKVEEIDPGFNETSLSRLLKLSITRIPEPGIPTKLFRESLDVVTLEEILFPKD
jgi:hypothetical protein